MQWVFVLASWVVMSAAWAAEFALVADPRDPFPPEARAAVIMIHGYDGTVSEQPFESDRDRTFRPFMAASGYRHLWNRFKFYRFTYRPYRSLPELGAGCARSLLAELPPDVPIIFLGHSAGGLVARFAGADLRLVDRVAGIITLATPHHGSVSASILMANGKVVERLGCVDALLMLRTQRNTPITPALRSLRSDGFDAHLTVSDQIRYNMPVNDQLAYFNRIDPNIGKIFAYMGQVRNLWGKYQWGIAGELHRRALAHFDPAWASADPVVHLPSGIFAGAPVAAVRLFPGRSHTELPADPEVMRDILHDLVGIWRSARAARLFTHPGAQMTANPAW
jgi:hypothetical protein